MFVITVKFVIHEKDIDKFKTRIYNKLETLLNLKKIVMNLMYVMIQMTKM